MYIILFEAVSIIRQLLKKGVLHKQCSNRPIYLPLDPVNPQYGGTGRSPRSIGPSCVLIRPRCARFRSVRPKEGKSPHAKDLEIFYDPLGPDADPDAFAPRQHPPASSAAAATDLRHRISHTLPIPQHDQLSAIRLPSPPRALRSRAYSPPRPLLRRISPITSEF
jgi:hypothetical protein